MTDVDYALNVMGGWMNLQCSYPQARERLSKNSSPILEALRKGRLET